MFNGFEICLILFWTTLLPTSWSQVTECLTNEGWQPSGSHYCLLVSTENNPGDLTWEKARQKCPTLHPWASVASLPTDENDNSIASRLTPGTPYWIGMKVNTSLGPSLKHSLNNLIWLDGSVETRPSQFSLSKFLSGSPTELCGHVNLTIHPLQHELTWSLAECNDQYPYICIMDEEMSNTKVRAESKGSYANSTAAIALKRASQNTSLLWRRAAQNTLQFLHKANTTSKAVSAAASAAAYVPKEKIVGFSKRQQKVLKAPSSLMERRLIHPGLMQVSLQFSNGDRKNRLSWKNLKIDKLNHTMKPVCGKREKYMMSNFKKFLQYVPDQLASVCASTTKTQFGISNLTLVSLALLYQCFRECIVNPSKGNVVHKNKDFQKLSFLNRCKPCHFLCYKTSSFLKKSRRQKRRIPILSRHIQGGRSLGGKSNQASSGRGSRQQKNNRKTTYGINPNKIFPTTAGQTTSIVPRRFNLQTIPIIVGTASPPTIAVQDSTDATTSDSTKTSPTLTTGFTPANKTNNIQKLLSCNSSSLIDCLDKSANSIQYSSLTRKEKNEILESSNLLLDELNKALFTDGNVDKETILKDFLRLLNSLLELSVETRNKIGEERINKALYKADDFLDNVLTNTSNSDFDKGFRLTLGRLDILVTGFDFGSVLGSTLKMKRGAVTIDGIHVPTPTNKSARTIVSALVFDAPSTEVWLAQGDQTVRAMVVSPILALSARVGDSKASLEHTFSLAVHSPENISSERLCGFQSVNESDELWETYGCEPVSVDQLISTTNMSQTVMSTQHPINISNSGDEDDVENVECHCNHTTNFAILMQIVDFKVSKRDELVLSIITYIGCSITLITLGIAVTVFTCIRSLNSERVCVHRNLCIAIMAAQLTFISGIKSVEDKVLCAIVALFLHYFYTAAFVWMLVEGLHLYSKVVRVFGTEKSRILYYISFGWGVPLILVAVSAAVDWDGYGTDKSCWLSIESSTVWAFVGPAVAILIVNFVILIIVLRIVVTSAKSDKQHEDYDHVVASMMHCLAQIPNYNVCSGIVLAWHLFLAGLKASLFLAPLLGLTWIFGLAAVNGDLIVFQYIFAVLNSLQGFFIFLCHCVFNSEVRQTLKRMREKRSLQKGEFATTSSTTKGRPSSSESRSPTGPPLTLRESVSPVFRRVNQVAPSTPPNDGPHKNEKQGSYSKEGLSLMYI